MSLKIAFTSIFDAKDVHQWSGTPYYMAKGFTETGSQVDYIGPLKKRLSTKFKIQQVIKKITQRHTDSTRFNIAVMKEYAQQVAMQLNSLSSQVVLATQVNPIAYLDCKQPIVLWGDALFALLVGFHAPSSTISQHSINEANEVTREALKRCRLALFSSDWAARGAMELYGMDKAKVHVVPFGANLSIKHNLDDIRRMIAKRSRDTIKLLYIGKMWEQKGGDIVLKVAKALHAANHPVELHLVGCVPPEDLSHLNYIKCHGFISKNTPAGLMQLSQLLQDAHFLFLPTRADCYGIVFAEASAYGVPSLTSYIGGVSTAVRDQVNGITLALDTPTERYCDIILNLMDNYSQYEALALSSFNEYETRLNWHTATKHASQLIKEIV